MNICENRMMKNTQSHNNWVGKLAAEFIQALGVRWFIPADLQTSLRKVLEALGPEGLRSPEERQRQLRTAVNSKLGLNQSSYQWVLDTAARHKLFFNYHEKAEILRTLNDSDRVAFLELLLRRSVSPQALSEMTCGFRPATADTTFCALKAVVAEDERAPDVLRSLFSAYAFLCFQPRLIHDYFSEQKSPHYQSRFYDYLRHAMPEVFHRACGLAYLRVDAHLLHGFSDDQKRAKVTSYVRYLSERLSNHCHLGILIKSSVGREADKWQLYSDIVLYAEKRRETVLQTGYFHPDKIAAQTAAYIPNLDVSACRFEVAQEGLYFKDCFVITYPASQTEPDLLLLFEKNERDETPIPCPACRSSQVRGNSYPVLGVRSWECRNLICPERSKYDRGNRYSLSSLIRQEAIEEEDAAIPLASLRAWKRDRVSLDSEGAVLEMLVRHYSLMKDCVTVINSPVQKSQFLGRNLIEDPSTGTDEDDTRRVFDGPYFHRIYVDRPWKSSEHFRNLSRVSGVEVYCGDCYDVLSQMEPDSVDGIVTSPPYYNAREYAKWPNIYCFLYDQYNVAKQLHRVLKPGGLFLYNIFDYFDNENNIVFSAMGKKRMILGAYAINLFQRAGFALLKNVIWDKGEIEGKRNFNQGNRSPYYQSPFNCWEHILVLSKGLSTPDVEQLPFILRAQPVVKMIGGRNILGHTAPYPEAIPDLLLDLLEPRSTVLDPYAGSMTTARAAYRRGINSISIDYKEDYCRLGLDLLLREEQNLFCAA